MIFTKEEQPKMFYLCNIIKIFIESGQGWYVQDVGHLILNDEFCTFIQYVHETLTPKQLRIFYKVAANFQFFMNAP